MAGPGFSKPGRRTPGPRRSGGSPAGPEAVRRAVLDAAADLFARRDVEGVSLRDIAAAADVQLALIGRYVGTRRELIDAVFDDLSASLAQELVDRPLEQISFERDSTMGRWIVVLHHLVVTGAGRDRTTASFNPVRALAGVLEENYGADPAGTAVRAAQIAALALGWRLFERYLIAAGGLEAIPVQDLRDEVTALNRRIGATPWPSPPGLALPDTRSE